MGPGSDRIETKRIKFVRFNCPSKIDLLDVVVVVLIVVVIVVLECTMITMDGLGVRNIFGFNHCDPSCFVLIGH